MISLLELECIALEFWGAPDVPIGAAVLKAVTFCHDGLFQNFVHSRLANLAHSCYADRTAQVAFARAALLLPQKK